MKAKEATCNATCKKVSPAEPSGDRADQTSSAPPPPPPAKDGHGTRTGPRPTPHPQSARAPCLCCELWACRLLFPFRPPVLPSSPPLLQFGGDVLAMRLRVAVGFVGLHSAPRLCRLHRYPVAATQATHAQPAPLIASVFYQPLSPQLKVLTYNIWNYNGDWAQRLQMICGLVKKEEPHVIGWQEVLPCDAGSDSREPEPRTSSCHCSLRSASTHVPWFSKSTGPLISLMMHDSFFGSFQMAHKREVPSLSPKQQPSTHSGSGGEGGCHKGPASVLVGTACACGAAGVVAAGSCTRVFRSVCPTLRGGGAGVVRTSG